MTYHVVNGQRVYTRQEGAKSGQVALLIHGWSSSWYAMSPLLPLLSRRFCCIAVDLPGYGNSPPGPKPATIAGYADLLAALIQEVADKPVVLIGHSMGGMISLTLAQRHPILVERTVLLCPTISGRLSTFINFWVAPVTILEQYAITGRLTSALEPHTLNLIDRLMKPASFAERSGISEQDYKRLRADARRPGQGRVRAECFWAMREGDLRGKLNQIEAPSLILWGAEDNTVPLRDAGVVADEYPHADLRIIPKAGHWPQFETPDIMQRYIASYLGLPQITGGLKEVESPAAAVNAAAQFLAHSDVGNGLNLAQRSRLAAQCHIRSYASGEVVARAHEPGTELFIVQEGTVEVWSDSMAMEQTLGTSLTLDGSHDGSQRLANVLPGQISGELALLDGGKRSAYVRAGPQGATVLTLERERLVALCNDDPTLGNRLIWNIATTLALRLRLTNWHLHLESQKLKTIEEAAEKKEKKEANEDGQHPAGTSRAANQNILSA
jgi:pimeloyl-ACP methyl ester carboxylesterase/CRP-like cAMP-binding protein